MREKVRDRERLINAHPHLQAIWATVRNTHSLCEVHLHASVHSVSLPYNCIGALTHQLSRPCLLLMSASWFAKACRWCVDELRDEDGCLKCSSSCIPKKRGFSVSILEPRDAIDWWVWEDGSSLPWALTRGSLFFTARSAFSKPYNLRRRRVSAVHTACYVTGEGRVDLHCWETPWEHSCSFSCFLE